MSHIPRKKREWPDGEERVVDGSNVVFALHGVNHVSVCENTRDIRRQMNGSSPDAMLEFSHHADPEVAAYIRNDMIIGVVPRWVRLSDV